MEKIKNYKGDTVKRIIICGPVALAAQIIMALMLTTCPAQAAASYTQTIELHPGWNAIYLEVQPDPRDPATVFNGIPVESVWTRYDRNSPVEFIQDPAEGLQDKPGWLVYYGSPDKAMLNSLFAISSNRPYLIKLGGAQTVSWAITGSPDLLSFKWLPNSFNFVGFHLDPAAPPTFGSFFDPSSAHRNQAMYRLNQSGVWEFINEPAKTGMRSGEAYWVYCEGASTYSGPIVIDIDGGDFVFDNIIARKTLKISNLSGNQKTVSLQLSPAFPYKLVYRKFMDGTLISDYLDLSTMPPVIVPAGGAVNVTIYMQTQKEPATLDSILSITDSEGSRILAPLSVEN